MPRREYKNTDPSLSPTEFMVTTPQVGMWTHDFEAAALRFMEDIFRIAQDGELDVAVTDPDGNTLKFKIDATPVVKFAGRAHAYTAWEVNATPI